MSDDEKDGKSDKSEKSDKPIFITRVLAYIIDTFFIFFISALLVTPFMDSKALTQLSNETIELLEKYQKNEITDQEYTVEYSNLSYKMVRSTELVTIVSILLGVISFSVIPLYNNGQSIGKKIMKIKVVSLHGNLTANQLLFRSFIANSILLDIISVLFVMFASRDVYSNCVGIFSFIQNTIMLVSFFMILWGKEGLAVHDKLVHTKVVKVN